MGLHRSKRRRSAAASNTGIVAGQEEAYAALHRTVAAHALPRQRAATTKGPAAAPRPARVDPWWRPARLTARGFAGPGRGAVPYVEAPPEWRGTTVQVCGLFPYSVGGSAPSIGVPIGPSLLTGATVCCDPISWFQTAKLILNPSMFVLGLPGLGKSTFVRRIVLGLAASKVVPLILGDLKPDYVNLVRQLDGQIIRLGRGLGSLNVLDPGALDHAADELDATGHHAEATRLREEAHGRRCTMVEALIVLVRQAPTSDVERTVLAVAMRVLIARHREQQHAGGDVSQVPVLQDLIALLEEAPDEVREPTLDRGDIGVYRDVVDPLARSLRALTTGVLGDVFARPTSERFRMDASAVCVDVSGISENDKALAAAILLACWNEGFGAVEAANALADAGVGPQRRFLIVLDELWRVLRAGDGMVDKVDALTRLNRQEGVGQIMISHSMADLSALHNPEDREKARGFVERAGIVVCAGLPAKELDADLSQVVSFTAAERETVSSWSTPPGWNTEEAPPGRGKLLIKVGQRAGIPVELKFTPTEAATEVHDTNTRWNGVSLAKDPS